MTAPQPAPPRHRPARRRIAWWAAGAAFAAAVLAAVLAVVVPVSPLYLPRLLVPRAGYDGRSVASWMRQLSSDDADERAGGMFALGAIGPEAEAAVPALAAILGEADDGQDRARAAFALYKIAPASQAAVPALAKALADPEPLVRMNAAQALTRIGPGGREAAAALARGIDDAGNQTNLGRFHHTVQVTMVVALGRVTAGTGEGVPTLIALVKGDGTDDVRAAAARALGELGESARPAVPALKGLLSDNNTHLREDAELALKQLGEGVEARAEEPAELELPEDERAYIWQIENRGNELAKHGFGPLGKALKDADARALAAVLADDFAGSAPPPSAATRITRGPVEVVRQRATATPGLLDRPAFVARLLELRKGFTASAPDVQFGLKALRPKVRGSLDGEWEATAQVRLYGEHAKGAPAEVVFVLGLRLPRLTREALSKPGWLRGASVEQVTAARSAHPLFAEVAKRRGLRADKLHDNWKSRDFSPVTGGVYVTDFDRDGVLDVLITDLSGTALYRGKTDGTFEDVTEAVGLPTTAPLGNAVAWADLDGDGWDDLVLGGHVFRNEGGKRFADYTSRCNLRVPADASGLVVADYDRDGRLDLYATRPGKPGGKSWLDSRSAGQGNRLYRNKGGWQFDDVTKASGAGGGRRSTFTAAWLDADNDGWPDLHVINEFGDGVLLINNRDGTFRPTALASRPADFGSMGLAAGDIDNDGNIDLYCANMYSKAGNRVIGNLKADAYPADVMARMRRFVAGSQLHLNRGGLKFEQAGEAMQVAGVGWAYGTCLADLDNDGWLDIYATAGYVSRSRTEPDG